MRVELDLHGLPTNWLEIHCFSPTHAVPVRHDRLTRPRHDSAADQVPGVMSNVTDRDFFSDGVLLI